MLKRPAIDTVVRCVESTFRKPDNVTCLESTGANSVEGAVPVEGSSGHLIDVVSVIGIC